jgi:hypothetical protein
MYVLHDPMFLSLLTQVYFVPFVFGLCKWVTRNEHLQYHIHNHVWPVKPI